MELKETISLYHLSYDPIEQFSLRVPKYRVPGEDDSVRRICLAPCIEDCINAKPGRGEIAQIALERKIPLVLYLYKVEMPRRNPCLIHPVSVYRDYGVSDAIHNQEYWLTRVPEFEEHMLLLCSAKFVDTSCQYPTIQDVATRPITDLPEFCAQHFAWKANEYLGSHWDTDMFVHALPEWEEQAGRKAEKLTEKFSELCLDTPHA